MITTLFLLSLLVVRAEEAKQSDAEVYAAAVEAARTARIEELEKGLADSKAQAQRLRRKLDPKWIAAVQKELKLLKAKKVLPPMAIVVTSPKVGQLGTLTWPDVVDEKECRDQTCTVGHVLSKSEVLVKTSWTSDVIEVAQSYHRPTAAGFAPSRKIGEEHHTGPLLLFTNVDAGALADGMTWKPEGLFFVEATRQIDGATAFVLRRLVTNREKGGAK